MNPAQLSPESRLSVALAARCLRKRRVDVAKMMRENTIPTAVDESGRLYTTLRWLAEFNDEALRQQRGEVDDLPAKRDPNFLKSLT